MNEEMITRCTKVFGWLDNLHGQIKADSRLNLLLNNSIQATEAEKRILSCLYSALKDKEKCMELMKDADLTEEKKRKLSRSCSSLEAVCNSITQELKNKESIQT